MNIQGFQKLTLLDFPGKSACTVFTGGCNLRCPFCHNASLVIDINQKPEFSQEEILSFLDKRKNLLDGVAITGGEPLLQPDIKEFIKALKAKGFLVKLDTNGTFPKKLNDLLNDNLIDYVAMDIKGALNKYPLITDVPNIDIQKIKDSISLLKNCNVDYEFRTTVIKEYHEIDDFYLIGDILKGAPKHFLQCFKDSGNLINSNVHGVSIEDMEKMQKIMQNYVDVCEIRGN